VLTSRAAKVRVLAVRGTQLGVDLVGDASLYTTIGLMQVFSKFVPLFDQVPVSVLRFIVQLFEIERFTGEPQIWDPLLNATRVWKADSERLGYEFVLTGHSLGGVLAGIAGARIQIPAVAFSPPGQYYSLDRFQLQEEDMRKSLLVVSPSHDIVPQVDKQTGLTQVITCSASALDCHAIERTLCSLYSNCGDPRGRTWASFPNPEEDCL